MGELFDQYRIQHIVQDDRDYGQITISKNGYVKYRTTKNGKLIGRKRQFLIDLVIHPNTLLFTRQGVAEGAIGFAPKDVDGCIATENMPMFSLKKYISKNFVQLLLKSEQFRNKISKFTPTGSAQKSIHERNLMTVELQIPSFKEQNNIAVTVESQINKIHNTVSQITRQQNLLKKLRQAILQEAIEGKLTKQWRKENPDVEPASVLLKKIKSEKARLVAEKKIKKAKPLPPIEKDDIPFEIPETWKWCRVWEVAQLITSGSRWWAKYYADNGAVFVTMGNLSKEHYQLRMNKVRYVQPPKNSEGARTKLEEGDLLISITGKVGNLGLIPKDFGEAYINQHTCLLRFMPDCQNKYFPELMRSPLAKCQYDAPQRGIKNSFRLGDVGEMIIPLPPLIEQKAIVKKVDRLFAICDELELQINKSKANANMLMHAVLKEAFEH